MALFAIKTEENKKKKKEEKISDVKPENIPIENEKKAVKNKKIQNKTEKKDAVEIASGVVKNDVIIEPWITEKGHSAMAENKYIFRVRKEADKKNIKLSIEGLYGVKVVAVNVINVPAKKRMYGRHEGKKSGYKKAIVKLKEGDKIELFKGV